MELLFLDFKTLSYKDNAIVGEDFEIVLDSVVYQKSKFTVNKVGINAEIGDIVILRGVSLSFIGILDTMTVEKDIRTEVEVNDFGSLFDLDVLVSSYSGNLCTFLSNLIKATYKNNSDSKQNLSYLSVYVYASITGSLTYDGSELANLSDLSETLAKSYGIRYTYSLVYSGGKITGIDVNIGAVTKGLVIKHNLPVITDLKIADSKKQITNKIVFYPKDDNTSYKSAVSYFLLTDGTLTTNSYSDKRYPYVKLVSEFYSDSDYSTLLTKAQSELLKSNLEHSIEFDLSVDNDIIVPFQNFNLGDFVEFVGESKTYETMVTQLSFKNGFYSCSVVLGEYRVKLTDKIKLLQRR